MFLTQARNAILLSGQLYIFPVRQEYQENDAEHLDIQRIIRRAETRHNVTSSGRVR